MDEDEYPVWFGGGSLHSLREEEDEAPTSPLDGLRSVSAAAKRAYAPRVRKRNPRRRVIGFHIPKAR